MLPTNFTPILQVANAKLKLQLYDGGQGSVFTYSGPLNTTNYSPKYGQNVVDIVVRYETPNYTCVNHTNYGSNEIILCNFSKTIINDTSMQDSRARVLCHEIGHIFNLRHTFDCTNQCSSQIVNTIECGGGNCGCGTPSNPSNNLMSYGGSRSLTPCQWEVMFNAITSSNYAFVTWDCQKSATPFTVATGNVTWNNLKLINCDVIVPNGTQLYIYNDVKFVNDCKIYVQSGASLIVNNKTITSLCPSPGQWGGIESQGAVTLTNATIEHAVTGVSRKGGSLQTSLAIFKNNMRDIEYLDKSLTPIDKHVNSDFLVDNNYRGSMIRSRVTMWNSKQINFEGCKFENQHSNPYGVSWNLDYDWQGIYAVGSEFEVNKSVTSIFNRKSTFTNFAIGIRTASFGTANMTSVTNSVFDKNNIGVVSDEVGDIFIQNNIFNVRWNNSFPQTDWFRAGLLINSGSDYMVKNNQFVGIGNSSGQYTFGTLVMSTGESENRIESNKYTGLYVGNRVLQRNTNNSYQAPTGLQLLCGDHTASVYDNTIEQAYVYNAGIRYKQGGIDEDDGNFFSKNNDAFDIWTDTQDGFQRFYLNTSQFDQRRIAVVNNADLIQQTPTEGGPSCSSFVMFMSPNPNSAVNAAAMSSLSAAKLNPDNVLELTSAFEEADLALKTAKKQHTDLIDGGNQAGLLSNINSRWNRDTLPCGQICWRSHPIYPQPFF
jgi:Pregnancy-associated plasma protein-A